LGADSRRWPTGGGGEWQVADPKEKNWSNLVELGRI